MGKLSQLQERKERVDVWGDGFLNITYTPANLTQDLQEELDAVTNGTSPRAMDLMVAQEEAKLGEFGDKTPREYGDFLVDLQAKASHEKLDINTKWLLAMLDPSPNSWDLTGEDDRVLPVNETTIRALGIPNQAAIIGAIVKDIQKKGERKSKPYTGGLLKTL
jgi:hypothetical protein